jgi:hypothetical protein
MRDAVLPGGNALPKDDPPDVTRFKAAAAKRDGVELRHRRDFESVVPVWKSIAKSAFSRCSRLNTSPACLGAHGAIANAAALDAGSGGIGQRLGGWNFFEPRPPLHALLAGQSCTGPALICDRCHSLKQKMAAPLTLMTRIETHPVYVVAGTCGDKTQYWAAAIARRRARRRFEMCWDRNGKRPF